MTLFKWAPATIALLLSLGPAWAQDTEATGELEYLYGCAGCHGMFGEGDGPIGPMLNRQVPDLTLISQRNDGVFPFLHVIKTIDGRGAETRHPGIMLAWGDELEAEFGDKLGPFGTELMIRGRIMSLATFLASIQQ